MWSVTGVLDRVGVKWVVYLICVVRYCVAVSSVTDFTFYQPAYSLHAGMIVKGLISVRVNVSDGFSVHVRVTVSINVSIGVSVHASMCSYPCQCYG